MRSRPLALVGSLLLLASPLARAEASASPSSRAPSHEVHLDPGALADGCTWVVHVEKGDTLGEIAQRHLGSAKRAGEIRALNPRVDPKGLKVGQAIALPPKKGATAARWVDLLAASPGGTAQTVGLGEPATLPLGPVRIFAVPHDRLLVLRAASRGAEIAEAALRADPRVAVSEPVRAAAADGRALARAVTRLKVTGLDGAALQVSLLQQDLFGPSGHRVVPALEEGESGSIAVPLLLLLAGLVVFALVAIAARRMGRESETGTA